MKHIRWRIIVILHLSLGSLAQEIKAAETSWGFPQKAFEDGLNVIPETFQLISPFTSWDWPSASLGHLASSEFDFGSTVPEWSGTGAYAAGGGRLSDAYEFFLMALVFSADPVQKQKIEVRQDVCLDVRDQMQRRALQNAREAYPSDPSVVNNVSGFGCSCLTGPLRLGCRFNTAITGYRPQLDNEMDLLDTLIQQSNDPMIKRATEQLADQQYWSSVDTDSIKDA